MIDLIEAFYFHSVLYVSSNHRNRDNKVILTDIPFQHPPPSSAQIGESNCQIRVQKNHQ